jgi:hypothetical protein
MDMLSKTQTLYSLNLTMYYISSKLTILLTILALVMSGNILTAEKVKNSL